MTRADHQAASERYADLLALAAAVAVMAQALHQPRWGAVEPVATSIADALTQAMQTIETATYQLRLVSLDPDVERIQ